MIFVCMMVNYFINDKKKSLEPKFTLEIEQEDNNMVFDIKNVGKGITNARLEPYCCLIIDLQKGIELESEKIMGGCYKFLFTNFYESKEYFYNYERNSFTVRESKGDILLEFLKEIYTELLDYDIEVIDYAIQNYFKISYFDYNNIRHEQWYEISNNHIFYICGKDFCRYFNDNTLLKISEKKIPDFDACMPIYIEPKEMSKIIVEKENIFNKELNVIGDEIIGIQIYRQFDGSAIYDENNFIIGFREVTH